MADYPDFKSKAQEAKAYGHTLNDYKKALASECGTIKTDAKSLEALLGIAQKDHDAKIAKALKGMGELHGDYVKLTPLQKDLKAAKGSAADDINAKIDKLYNPMLKKIKEVEGLVKEAQATRGRIKRLGSGLSGAIKKLS